MPLPLQVAQARTGEGSTSWMAVMVECFQKLQQLPPIVRHA
jgi:hypothetical protein